MGWYPVCGGYCCALCDCGVMSRYITVTLGGDTVDTQTDGGTCNDTDNNNYDRDNCCDLYTGTHTLEVRSTLGFTCEWDVIYDLCLTGGTCDTYGEISVSAVLGAAGLMTVEWRVWYANLAYVGYRWEGYLTDADCLNWSSESVAYDSQLNAGGLPDADWPCIASTPANLTCSLSAV